MPLQQTTFENIVTKGEIAQNEQILILPQCFQFYSIIVPLIIENVHIFAKMFLKSSAAYLLYVLKR